MRKLIVILFAASFFFGCTESPEGFKPKYIDTGYFPVKINSWKIYNVQSINIDKPIGVYDTVNYQLKEVFADWFIDGQGDSLVLLKRYVRDNESGKWQRANTWLVGVKNNFVLQTEENIKYVKLNFPVELNKKWDGNSFNMQDTLKTYLFEYTTVDSVENYNSIMFDKVITVTQKYKSTLIDKISFKEKYQYGVGLIYKQKIDIYNNDSIEYGVPLENRVKKGTLYYQTISDYGTN